MAFLSTKLTSLGMRQERFLLVFFIAMLATTSTSLVIPRSTRIAYGHVIEKEVWGNANVRLNLCSGVLIANNWVLTAAHCTLIQGGEALVGRYKNSMGTRHTIVEVVKHPLAGRNDSVSADIALVRISPDVAPGRCIDINAQVDFPSATDEMYFMGYGITEWSKILKLRGWPSYGKAFKTSLGPKFDKIQDWIYTRKPGDDRPCRGDSGGGVVAFNGTKWKVVGVITASMSNTACRVKSKEADMVVSSAWHYVWIEEVIQATAIGCGRDCAGRNANGLCHGTPLYSHQMILAEMSGRRRFYR